MVTVLFSTFDLHSATLKDAKESQELLASGVASSLGMDDKSDVIITSISEILVVDQVSSSGQGDSGMSLLERMSATDR